MMKYVKYILISLIILIPCVLTVLIYNDKITQDSPVFYKQGVDFYNKGDYENAYYNFLKIKWISPLYPMALYKQAKSAQKVGDYNTAALKYELYLKKSPDSVFVNSARYNLARCYFYLKKYAEAKEQFLIIKQQKKDTPSKEDFFLGLISKRDNKQEAADYFRKYISGVLSGTIKKDIFLLSAADELKSLGLELSDNDKQLLGRIYYKYKRYETALEYFSKLPISNYWDYLVLVNHYAGHKVVAKKLIESGIVLYSSNADEERLHQIYDIYTSYMIGRKLKNWTKMLQIVQSSSLKGEDYVMYKLAGMLTKEKALILYKNIEEKYPLSNYAPESLWNVFWSEYMKKNYTKAEELAFKHLKQYTKVNSTTRIMFWLAKTQLKLNKTSQAHTMLSKLATKYPDDYYGLRAENILNKKDTFWKTNPLRQLPKNTEYDFPISLSDLNIKDLKIINTIVSLGDYNVWEDADFNNEIIESWFELKNNEKSRSIVLARDSIEGMEIKPPFISGSYKLAYPLYWVAEINIAGKKLFIDPFLITALIREESYFNENARSSSNAMGLMQLMPATANYMISKLNMDIPSSSDLTEPRLNLYLGCHYLQYLSEKFDNDLYVIAAYNGGEGSVTKWTKTFRTNDNDEFIENIPFDETRNYVKKVFRSYHLYGKIYE